MCSVCCSLRIQVCSIQPGYCRGYQLISSYFHLCQILEDRKGGPKERGPATVQPQGFGGCTCKPKPVESRDAKLDEDKRYSLPCSTLCFRNKHPVQLQYLKSQVSCGRIYINQCLQLGNKYVVNIHGC